MSSRRLYRSGLSVLALCVAFGVTFCSAADGSEKAPLQIGLAFARPIMITVETQQSGSITAVTRDYSFDSSIEFEQTRVFVDEYKSYEEDAEHAVRHFLKDFSEFNGDPYDSALNGVHADFKRKGEKWKVTLLDHRVLTDGLQEELTAAASSLGLWLDLPEDQEINTPFEVDLSPISSVITEPLRHATTTCTVKVDHYDAATTSATLSGTYEIKGGTVAAGTLCAIKYAGSIAIEVCTVESRLVRVSLDGSYEFMGHESKLVGDVTGNGDYDVTITTEIDLKAIKKARKKQPKFRARKFWAYGLGVGIKLPSYWSPIPSERPTRAFVRTLDGERGKSIIEISEVDQDSSDPGAYYDQVYVSLKARHSGLVVKKTKSPFGGDGRVFFVPKGKRGDALEYTQTEVYPWRGRFLRFKVSGPRAAFSAALKDFRRAKFTIRAIDVKPIK